MVPLEGRGWLLWTRRATARGESHSASASTQLLSDERAARHLHQRSRSCRARLLCICVGIDIDSGSRHDIYGEDGGSLVTDPLDGSLDPKLESSELPPLPSLPRQFWHGHEKGEIRDSSEEF